MADAILSANTGFDPRTLVREAAQGHVDSVRDIVSRYPEQVEIETALCYQLSLQLPRNINIIYLYF